MLVPDFQKFRMGLQNLNKGGICLRGFFFLLEWFQPHLNFPAKMTYNFTENWHFSLSNLAKTEVLPVRNCQKSIALELGNFEGPFSSNLVSSFWRENLNVVGFTTESLTFEKLSPLKHLISLDHEADARDWPLTLAPRLVRDRFAIDVNTVIVIWFN